MKFFKSIVLVAAIVAAATIVPEAKAQLGNPQAVFKTSNLTLNVLTNGVNVTNVFTLPPTAKEVGLEWVFQMSAAGTSNLTTVVEKSITGNAWQTLATVTLAGNGTTPVPFVTNLTVNAIQKIRLRTSTDSISGVVVTNATISAVGK